VKLHGNTVAGINCDGATSDDPHTLAGAVFDGNCSFCESSGTCARALRCVRAVVCVCVCVGGGDLEHAAFDSSQLVLLASAPVVADVC
jgi:hypothetical protein